MFKITLIFRLSLIENPLRFPLLKQLIPGYLQHPDSDDEDTTSADVGASDSDDETVLDGSNYREGELEVDVTEEMEEIIRQAFLSSVSDTQRVATVFGFDLYAKSLRCLQGDGPDKYEYFKSLCRLHNYNNDQWFNSDDKYVGCEKQHKQVG